MSSTVWGIVKEGIIIPDSTLPEGARVEIHIAADTKQQAIGNTSSSQATLPEPASSSPRGKWASLAGLGREVWEGIDAAEFLSESRDDGDRP